jgi:hypothetical protein
VTPASIRDYLATIRLRYTVASRALKHQILDELCATSGYTRKGAIRALNHQPVSPLEDRRGRPSLYTSPVRIALGALWEAAGYPWSHRLKAMLPLWLPWAAQRFTLSPDTLRQLQAMSPRTMDRVLHERRQTLQRRLYGRTKPGTLLKHHIPLRTDRWDVTRPGFTEIDLVSHAGPLGDHDSVFSLNLTDIHTTWVETRAVQGKTQRAICAALDELRQALPFPLRGIDSDNGSEFINDQLWRYCRQHHIQFTRGRPYKKDDNAHIEQKNWTHVRKLLGWERYSSTEALEAINRLYREELRLMMNLFQPSVKLQRRVRLGSRVRRLYDAPQTPLDRVVASDGTDPKQLQVLQALRQRLDPFALADQIDHRLTLIHRLAARGLYEPASTRYVGRPFRIRSVWAQRGAANAPSPR